MALISPGITVREVDVSYIIPTGDKLYFKVVDEFTIAILNWEWWDSGREYGNSMASRIHKWLDENTVLGADKACIDQKINFALPEELTAFVLKWS